jgi:hypothetical protein
MIKDMTNNLDQLLRKTPTTANPELIGSGDGLEHVVIAVLRIDINATF